MDVRLGVSVGRPFRLTVPEEPGHNPRFHTPLIGRVEAGAPVYVEVWVPCCLALSSASVPLSRPCHVSSPLHVARNVRISRIARPHLLHANAYGTYPAGATFGPSRRTL